MKEKIKGFTLISRAFKGNHFGFTLMSKALKESRLGFTLIELLVVISIIGILLSIGLVSLTSVQKRARDGQRKADLKQIQSALEMYYANNSATYPASVSFGLVWNYGTPAVNYMRKVPNDPTPGKVYCYVRPTTVTYDLYAKLENTSDPDASTSYSVCTSTYNYHVQNPL